MIKRAPFVGVDAVGLAIGQDVGGGMNLADHDVQGDG